MASIQLQPPEPFTFHKPDEWSWWIKRFEQFHLGSGLSSTSEQRQINTLLYCLGQDAKHVLQSMHTSEEGHTTYEGIQRKFDGFFKVRCNVIWACRVQPEDSGGGWISRAIYSHPIHTGGELWTWADEGGADQRQTGCWYQRYCTLRMSAVGPRPDAREGEKGSLTEGGSLWTPASPERGGEQEIPYPN